MLKFSKDNIQEIKALLYRSCIHDAKLVSIYYDAKEKTLKIITVNPIFNVGINFIFSGVTIFFATKGHDYGDCNTILSLTVENDFSYLPNDILKYQDNIKDVLYLVFQMFSGDELHIVCKEVIIEL